jgi:hypothetical protein
MSKVFTGASMSLDGYISGPNETGFEHLFKWMGNGDVEVPTANPELTPRMTEGNAKYFREMSEMTGALVVGRKLFDFTSGWGPAPARQADGRRHAQRAGRVAP